MRMTRDRLRTRRDDAIIKHRTRIRLPVPVPARRRSHPRGGVLPFHARHRDAAGTHIHGGTHTRRDLTAPGTTEEPGTLPHRDPRAGRTLASRTKADGDGLPAAAAGGYAGWAPAAAPALPAGGGGGRSGSSCSRVTAPSRQTRSCAAAAPSLAAGVSPRRARARSEAQHW